MEKAIAFYSDSVCVPSPNSYGIYLSVLLILRKKTFWDFYIKVKKGKKSKAKNSLAKALTHLSYYISFVYRSFFWLLSLHVTKKAVRREWYRRKDGRKEEKKEIV